MTKTLAEYERWLAEQNDLVMLRRECLEQMRITVSLFASNAELRHKVERLEEGRDAQMVALRAQLDDAHAARYQADRARLGVFDDHAGQIIDGDEDERWR